MPPPGATAEWQQAGDGNHRRTSPGRYWVNVKITLIFRVKSTFTVSACRHGPRPYAAPHHNEPAIRIESLSKTYEAKGAPPKRALDEVSFDMPRGQIFGLLGPNGAGKSTLINILAGLVTKTSGEVTIWGFDIDEPPRNSSARSTSCRRSSSSTPSSHRANAGDSGGPLRHPKTDRISDELLAAMHLATRPMPIRARCRAE